MMKSEVKKEVEALIKKMNLDCSVKEFHDKVDWDYISRDQILSEDFIREFKDAVNWYDISHSQVLSEDFIREFKDKVNWVEISCHQALSEDFIREFKDKVSWDYISYSQVLSEDFIREFKNDVDWCNISPAQMLSEDFIREFKDEVDWVEISRYQVLSEDFIREFKDKVDWDYISCSQALSEDFIREFKNDVDTALYDQVHKAKTLEDKTREVQVYAEKHDLEFDGEYLYAYRNHDKWGRGAFNKTLRYEQGQYYKDWHCDMRENEENSFGLGIWPKGNTPVKVKVEDWGVAVNKEDGKARVWGFEVI